MSFTELQQHYFDDRYALKDANGNNVETEIPQMWDRVATAIADDEWERKAFRRILQDFKFVPGGRILAGAGAESEKTYYNCYVIPVEADHPTDHYPNNYPGNDSREAIFDTIKTMVDIMSRGGGVGINWSVLRPSGSYLTRISGTSSGPVGWMDVASKAVGEVIQGGSRRGAAMFMLDDWHPNVLDFIDAKRQKDKITNANVSVAVSDRFMEAVKNDEDWPLVFPDTTDPSYNKEWDGDIQKWQDSGRPVVTYSTIKARSLWDAIAEAAWASGEPGVVFLDRYNKLSTAEGIERLISVNPCGEQGLGPYSVCNLGAMNLDAYVKYYYDPAEAYFDWDTFRDDVRTAVVFLDNIVDKNYYFLPQNKRIQMRLRRIGLSVMGLADALVRLGIRYGSPESVEFTENVFKAMKDEAITQSAWLAIRKGPAPDWRPEMWNRPYFKEFAERNPDSGFIGWPMRNVFLLTQAPTGTTSLLAGVNSGIEPYFNLKTWREDRTGGRYVYAKAVAEAFPADYDGGYIYDYIVTAKDVSVEEHIAIQAAVQRYCDSSVSKTINAPENQTLEETKKAFRLAYESGLKGVAYYRDGSRTVQVLYNEDPNEVIKRLTDRITELEEMKVGQVSLSHTKGPQIVAERYSPERCPACEMGEIVREEGCMKCYSCGWSAC